MRIVCAWCQRMIKEVKDFYGLDAPDIVCPVSHGICPECYAKQEHLLDAVGPGDHSTVTDVDHGGEG